MPANLTPQYKKAEERFREARTPEEKVAALEEMLSVIPKHKGTEKMQADIKTRIAKFKDRDEASRKSGAGRRVDPHHIPLEGVAQLILVGPPNAGKSALLCAVTNAVSEVAPYPYTTRKPVPGMMTFENLQFQFVDTPPVSDQFVEPWLPRVVRNAQGALIVVALDSPDVLEETETVLKRLEEGRVRLVGWRRWEKVETPVAWRKSLVVGTRLDCEGARDNARVLEELLADRFDLVSVSTTTGAGLHALGRAVFDMQEIVRAYTRARGKLENRASPFVLPKGSTVIDLAERIHKDLVSTFQFARVWGSAEYEGQRVQRDYVLQDEDVVEIHAT